MTSGRRGFASDNYAGIHPEVLAAMAAVNGGHVPAYGGDQVTEQAVALFRQNFGAHAEVFFAFNGTGANVIGLQSMLHPFEHVICAESAHINVDECGAPERFLGSKLVVVPTEHGKLTPDAVERVALGAGDQHHVQPRVVSIAQSTELGTVYTVDEIRALADWAHARSMFLHLDGARLSNAAAALGVGLGDLTTAAGVDILSFGGTKNGAMGAEAVVVLRPELAVHLLYIRKQGMQLASKMRFVAAQFVALLTDELWHRNAAHAKAMAHRLLAGVRTVPGVTVVHPVEANAVFASLPRDVTAALQRDYAFYVWDESADQVRWMASFDTTAEDVDGFVRLLTTLMSTA